MTYRSATEKSVLCDRHFWKGLAIFGAGCVVMSVVTSLATSSWLKGNEQAYLEPIRQGELQPAEALALWAAFPVTASPRPVVVVGPDYRRPDFGDAAKDLAFSLGRWDVPKRMTVPPRVANGYPIRYVGAVLEELRSALEQSATAEDVANGAEPGTAAERAARPAIRDATLELASFTTDRGVRTLPAWVVSFRNQVRPLVVLAIAEPTRFIPRTSRDADSQLRVSADGLELTYAFVGAPPGRGPCEAEYEPVVEESLTAVAVGAKTYLARPRDEAACGPANIPRTVSIQLTQPLGARVAITAQYGAPLAPLKERAKA